MDTKFAFEPLEEIEYSEHGGGLMAPVRISSAVKTMALAGGDLAYMEVRPREGTPYVIVFGWRVSETLLKSGFVKTEVRAVEDGARELLERAVGRELRRPTFAW